jgi:hypothetical protein
LNIIASTAAVAAATTTVPAMASDRLNEFVGEPAASHVSFPKPLFDRFVRIREQWSTQSLRDKVWSTKIDQLFFEETKVSFANVDYRDPRFRRMLAIHDRITQENPENDPVDEDGSSIVWNEIQEELFPVVTALLDCKPRSVVDLAWQVEAILLADGDLREGRISQHPEVPILIDNIRRLAGPLSVPSIIPLRETVDPILAAIEAHKKDCEAYEERVRENCRLETKLPKERRQSKADVYGEEIVESDDPRWVASERAVQVASSATDDSAIELHDLGRRECAARLFRREGEKSPRRRNVPGNGRLP